MNFYPDSYYNDPKYYKRNKIGVWKSRCVIYENFDELYDTYMNTMNCSYCNKEFKNSRNRHLDHCHKTGEFRAIVCRCCNTHDSYLKYPPHFTSEDKQQKFNKEYKETNRDKIMVQNKEYRESNPDKIIEKNKKYHQENRVKLNENKKKYRKANKLKVNCFFCAKHMLSSSLNPHYLNGYCVIKPK
tara:strand:- start:18 stop:575 length:558 start_codon:yes stop_codon:yes gene_type:complete